MMKRILVIDNEAHWIQFVESDLPEPEFEIVVARNMQEALHALEVASFDVVIASARYLNTLDAIKGMYGDRRIIVTTMRPTPAEASEAFGKGANRYLPKSFSPHYLSDRIDELERVLA